MRRAVLLLLVSSAAAAAQPVEDLKKSMDEVARIAGVMVDGDVCQRIMTARAKEYLVKVDPRDEWIDADNFDVNAEPYIQIKKTLIRLAHLVNFPCDVNLWMPVAEKPGRVQVLIRNVNEMSQFWSFGQLHQPSTPEMRQVLETGERVMVSKRRGMVSVLGPVRNSLGDVVGFVEAVSQVKVDLRENVK